MKIRNLPYDELNEKEQKIVMTFWKSQTEIRIIDGEEFYECEHHPVCKKSIQDFWEAHREGDTENGEYDGWNEGD